MALIPPENHAGIATIASAAVMGTMAIIAVFLRVWARRLKGARLDGSDWTCISALVGFLPCSM